MEQGGRRVPEEVKGWNWGVFMYNIAWGICNKSYLTLLCLVPIFNIVWIFVCGFKGNEWAWSNGGYRDDEIELFKRVQKTWNRAGLFSFILGIAIFIIYLLFFGLFMAAFYNNY